MATQRVLVLSGGGDCPGLNAVIRGVVRRCSQEKHWEAIGSIEAFNGILNEPQEIIRLDLSAVRGIHVKGGTIIGTTNRGGPFNWPIKNADGTSTTVDRSDELLRRLQFLGVEAVISIGGDGSQRISQKLYEKGLKIIGVPKTIDNDLSSTDFTFGFQTAVQIATEAIDKLVTTAASHNRLMILEVMGRDAGWIALNAAIAGGAEIALIPEFPYDIDKVVEKVESRIVRGKGFAILVVAEGAKPKGGETIGEESNDPAYEHKRLGGIGLQLMHEITAKADVEARVTVLGHLQRGGQPVAFDRVLATEFGVYAFEQVLAGKFGHMVAYKHPHIISVPILEAVAQHHAITWDDPLVRTALGVGISLGV